MVNEMVLTDCCEDIFSKIEYPDEELDEEKIVFKKQMLYDEKFPFQENSLDLIVSSTE